jgi:transposase
MTTKPDVPAQEPKKKVGRPTKYDPALCEKVVELGKLGRSRTAIAVELGIGVSNIPNWEQEHPAFLRAMQEAQGEAKKYYEALAESHMIDIPQGPKLNTQLFKFIVQARFPEYRESSRLELTGKNEGPVQIDVIHDLSKDLITDLLAIRQEDADS